MIKIKRTKELCCEDISQIENYEAALADETQTWVCHHRKGIELNKSKEELIEMGLYYNRPACELMFLTKSEHQKLHCKLENIRKNMSVGQKKRWQSKDERTKVSLRFKGTKHSAKWCANMSKPRHKFVWMTPDGNIVIMTGNASKWHPDWIKIERID